MTKEQKEKYLKDKGWFPWYNKNYWCHWTKTTSEEGRKNGQDPTNYGLSLDDAYEFETKNKTPFKGQILGYMGGLRW